MSNNADFPNPPVTMAALDAARSVFNTAIGIALHGSPADTADKDNKREVVVGMLRLLAGYVQEKCNNDLATLLASGFEAVSTNRAQSPLVKPGIVSIDNGNSGQLLVKVKPVANAACYEVRYSIDGGKTWFSGGLFTNSRSMPVNGLTPGSNYTFQVRAVGGSTGYSDWSDPVSHMSM